MMNFIDLFSGAGGLSEGFINAGFKPLAHVEIDKGSCFTLKTRLAYHLMKANSYTEFYYKYLEGSINRSVFYSKIPKPVLDSVLNFDISTKNLPVIFEKIDNIKNNKEIDIIIGGPPCQAYSKPGRSADKNRMINDPRNYLYLLYGRFLKRYNPKLFIFENVPGLYDAENGKYYKNLMKYFRKLGYCVEDKILDAVDFGVIQRRERVFIVGWRKNLNLSYPVIDKMENEWIVKDIFTDLPDLKPGDNNRISEYKGITSNEYLTKFNIRNSIDFVTLNYARPHNEKDLEIYRLAINYLRKGKRLSYNEVPEDLRTQNNITSFRDRFKVVDPDNVSHTLIAHIAKDGHHYIHPDIKQLRSISVREAARIQSFPDNYYFEGSIENQNRFPALQQIGNAVPPVMSERLANFLYSQLTEYA